jgi:hypothetical protein
VHSLGLAQDPFLTTEPVYCTTFSKCVRKGKDLELSGTEPYQGLVLPLIKGLRHLQASEAPPKTAVYFDLHIGIGIAVLDAPMIGIEVNQDGNELLLSPWVRVVRHEYVDDEESWRRSRVYAIEVVHKDFFREYVDRHAKPFANRLAERALRHQEELGTGLAFAKGMEKNCWSDIEARLRPSKRLSRRLHKD